MKWQELRYTAWSGGDVAEGLLTPSALGGPLPCTGPGEGGRHTAALLVRVVPAVVVIVTLPAARHAAVVLAAELVRLTGALVWGRGTWGSQRDGSRIDRRGGRAWLWGSGRDTLAVYTHVVFTGGG